MMERPIRQTISRRGAIKGLGASALSAGVFGSAGLAQSKAKPKNMWVSLAAYSVRDALTSGRMDLFQFIDWCAQMDLAGAELTSYYFPEKFDGIYLRRLRNHAFRSGVTISGTAVRNNFCLPPGPEKDREIDQVKKWIDYASELWAPHMRVFAGSLPKDAGKQQGLQWVAEGIKAVLDHAAEKGVVIGLENHGGIVALAPDLQAICDAVGKNPWFGVNLDTGNFQKDPYREVAMMVPLAVNVQVKVEVFENGKKVPADLDRMTKILIDGGYRGWVALEYEAEGDPMQEVPKYVRRLKELLEG